MSIEDLFRKLFGSYDARLDAEIDVAWIALRELRDRTRNRSNLEWVCLSSMTSSKHDIGGVVIDSGAGKIQLFVSKDCGLDRTGKFTGYTISLFRPSQGIQQIWNSGGSTDETLNLSSMVQTFESQLGKLLGTDGD